MGGFSGRGNRGQRESGLKGASRGYSGVTDGTGGGVGH